MVLIPVVLTMAVLTVAAGITLENPALDMLGPEQTCTSLLDRYKAAEPASSTPPRNMPEEDRDVFSMHGQVAFGEMFVDDTLGGKGSHYQFPSSDVDHMVKSATSMLAPGSRGRRRLAPMDQWLFSALDEHPVTGGCVTTAHAGVHTTLDLDVFCACVFCTESDYRKGPKEMLTFLLLGDITSLMAGTTCAHCTKAWGCLR